MLKTTMKNAMMVLGLEILVARVAVEDRLNLILCKKSLILEIKFNLSILVLKIESAKIPTFSGKSASLNVLTIAKSMILKEIFTGLKTNFRDIPKMLLIREGSLRAPATKSTITLFRYWE
jgi:hypothetical protein